MEEYLFQLVLILMNAFVQSSSSGRIVKTSITVTHVHARTKEGVTTSSNYQSINVLAFRDISDNNAKRKILVIPILAKTTENALMMEMEKLSVFVR
eukprot:gene8187-14119_t